MELGSKEQLLRFGEWNCILLACAKQMNEGLVVTEWIHATGYQSKNLTNYSDLTPVEENLLDNCTPVNRAKKPIC